MGGKEGGGQVEDAEKHQESEWSPPSPKPVRTARGAFLGKGYGTFCYQRDHGLFREWGARSKCDRSSGAGPYLDAQQLPGGRNRRGRVVKTMQDSTCSVAQCFDGVYLDGNEYRHKFDKLLYSVVDKNAA